MNSDLVEVCKLGKTIGLKGFVKLHDLSDFPSQFKKGAKFYDADSREFTLESYDTARKVAKFVGFDDVDQASNLTNLTLYRTVADTRKYCKLSNGEYFYFDVVGCDVLENELNLGSVADILEVANGFLFCVKTHENLSNFAKEFFIPYSDRFVEKIDIAAKKIYVRRSLEILENS